MGFWKKLGKIAAFAAPIVAAPFTGGTSLALLGAGSGAAGAALSGKGLKGMLAGAGLGAIPGLGKMGALGPLSGAVSGGANKAGSYATDTLRNIPGSGVGGNVVRRAAQGLGNAVLGGGGNNVAGTGESQLDKIMKVLGIAGMGKELLGGGGDDGGRFSNVGEPYRGGVSIDPRDLLSRGIDTTEQMQAKLNQRMQTPVRLRSSFVQQPPVFTGGGLPMPIGVQGQDPALADPSLMSSSDEAMAALNLLGDSNKQA